MKRAVGSCLLALSVLASLGADSSDRTAADKQALAPLQAYVGQWRGVAQPKRGSAQGAWTEVADWAWRFADSRAGLVATLNPGKLYAQLQLQAGDKPGEFVLLASPAPVDNQASPAAPVRFTGRLEDDSLVVRADAPQPDQPARITIRLVAGGDRMVVLYEKQAAANTFARLFEVGSTRQGSSFAKQAASGPECVVTGGLGTIEVTHAGQTYYVCCGGCRDLFLDDPDGILAEYRARKEQEKKK